MLDRPVDRKDSSGNVHFSYKFQEVNKSVKKMSTDATHKLVYRFSPGYADGDQDMKNLLGGKGSNLAEMCRLGLPVPPGFTITTEVCETYNKVGRVELVKLLEAEVRQAIQQIEEIMGSQFGDPDNPCLLSVRSGARVSMPGMMDTVLDLGLNDATVEGLANRSGKSRFAWDSYRRFLHMYGDVVMQVKKKTDNDSDPFAQILENLQNERNLKSDQEMDEGDLRELVNRYKYTIRSVTGISFPEDPWEQLWNSITAVFESWYTPRAVFYRELHDIPDEWGTAVNVQAMVYGNMGEDSGSGVAFTRDAATGEKIFNGEYLLDAQGEDVVAGVRTPREISLEGSKRWAQLARVSEEERVNEYPSLEEKMPTVFKQLNDIQQKLESHYSDMQDLEFTMQQGKLWILQTRTGKRTGKAMVNIGMDMFREGLISEEQLLMRMDPQKIGEMLHPEFEEISLARAKVIAHGLPASPGAATGRIVFFPEDAIRAKEKSEKVILVRMETSADDLEGMAAAQGILTARGGMTSHAAVVARGMGKCCISGAGAVRVDYTYRKMEVDGVEYREGTWISLNGNTGDVYEGQIETISPEISGSLRELLTIADRHATMEVKANADTPESAGISRDFGAKGIGLCRTEHMFFQGNRILAVREMIMASDEEGRRKALAKLLPMQQFDFEEILGAMEGLPVTIRLIDPPLHEFMPFEEENQLELADDMGVPVEMIRQKVRELAEVNPMLGHRGCRLGNTYPEITRMQTRAILTAAVNLKKKGVATHPEIMVPLVGSVNEYRMQEDIIRDEAAKIFSELGESVDFKVGTMIEVPRAALIAEDLAEYAEFFSFGTNDLTQMTFGFSRDDAGKFLPLYVSQGLLTKNPFERLDEEGVGELLRLACDRGRQCRPDLPVGICGEHGGDPESIYFCQTLGLDYVSCSPYRVPVARVAAARARALAR
jgi:pyruvate,orthophosphate dikinase